MPYGTNDEAEDEDYKPTPDVEDYLEWVKAKYKESKKWTMDSWLNVGNQHSFYGCFHFQPEFGESNVLLIRPVSCPDWSRYDDTIDYVEATQLYTGPEPCLNKYHTFDGGIYPFANDFMDAETGEDLPWDRVHWWILSKNNRKNKELTAEDIQAMDMAAQDAGYADHEEALRRVVPKPPDVVRDLCEFAGIFTDPSVVNQLRPMLYEYWA